MAHRHGRSGSSSSGGGGRDSRSARRRSSSSRGSSSKGTYRSDEQYDPERPQFVPSESSRAYYARILADGFRLVDEKPDATNVGIFQATFALVEGVDPGLVSAEHRARHEFLVCMRGVQCLLERGGFVNLID